MVANTAVCFYELRFTAFTKLSERHSSTDNFLVFVQHQMSPRHNTDEYQNDIKYGGASITNTIYGQTGVHSRLFLRLWKFLLEAHIIAIREVFFFNWLLINLKPIFQHCAYKDRLQFKRKIFRCFNRSDVIGFVEFMKH